MRFAFSLVELIISMLVLAVAASVAAPRFGAAVDRQRAVAAAGRIAADLKMTRQHAMARSTTQQVVFDIARQEYTLPGVRELNRSSGTYLVKMQTHPYNSTLLSATLGTDTIIIFDRFGKPDSGGTIVVKSGAVQVSVSVNSQTGRAVVL